jgi:hypothetical protein
VRLTDLYKSWVYRIMKSALGITMEFKKPVPAIAAEGNA